MILEISTTEAAMIYMALAKHRSEMLESPDRDILEKEKIRIKADLLMEMIMTKLKEEEGI